MAYLVYDSLGKKYIQEKIFGEKFLEFFYPKKQRNFLLNKLLFLLIAKWPLSSFLYGLWQKRKESRKNILPFVNEYAINFLEFEKKINEFYSFNDFFIRKLQKSARPIDPDPNILIMPADGRYLLYPNFEQNGYLDIKGQKLSLLELLDLPKLPWNGPTCVAIIRLAPVDYHRFHFPVSAKVVDEKKIGGFLYSVNPKALKQNISYLTANKREVTKLYHPKFKTVFMAEIGATHVGSICQTYAKQKDPEKGEEKGYFEFGGSCIVLALENQKFTFDETIVFQTNLGYETLGKMGQPLIKACCK